MAFELFGFSFGKDSTLGTGISSGSELSSTPSFMMELM